MIYDQFIEGYSESEAVPESKETPSKFAGVYWLIAMLLGGAFWYGVYSLIF